MLGEKYLTDSYLKRQQSSKSLPPDHPGLFKGTLMAFSPISAPEEAGDLILLAFEDSTIGVYDLRTKEMLDSMKHPKRHEFLCWTVLQEEGDGKEAGVARIAVSVIGQVYLVTCSPNSNRNNKYINLECVIKKCFG